ncbi:hypothetical protein ACJ41O_001176 [Fusarium nematophilum]
MVSLRNYLVTDLAGLCCLSSSSNTQCQRVKFNDAETFVGVEDPALQGKLSPEFTYITVALLDEQDLELEATLSVPENSSKPAPKSYLNHFSIRCSLSITIYGPMELFDDVGSFFQDHDIHLQHPVNCSKNVPYCNPHWLTSDDSDFRFTSELASGIVQPSVVEDVSALPELLDVLNSSQDLVETEQPKSIRTQLARHQKQALTFMLQREDGWAWDGCRPDLWEAGANSEGHIYFHNRVSGGYQSDEPPQFYGGIVADPMGLGKSLSMIALIACDLQLDLKDPSSLSGADAEESSGRTLVIVPPQLLVTWEEQLQQHTFPNSLAWCRHYGKSRITNSQQLEDTLIVLTTYHTVMKEWGSGNGIDTSTLFKTRWKRIVLDEAHCIRNGESQMARSICALESVARWAVTGTPIQNKLGDLTTLLKFLKVYPYMDKRAFDIDISHPWKSGKVDEAVKRLKRLSGCLLLRRPKGILQLPKRHDLKYTVELSPAERHLYEEIKTQVIAHIDQALLDTGVSWRSKSFLNVLQKIEAMRMVCDLGLHYHTRHEPFQAGGHDGDSWYSNAQGVFNLRREIGQIQCQACSATLDMAEEINEAASSGVSLFSSCFVVVFSTWKMTLNVVEAGLRQASIPALRFDGSVPQKDRQGVIDRFRTDPTIRVLLLTLSCGAVGLTLTEASRAYLIEPHWNPTIEDQALARIHRMGQRREVTTVRFVVKDSFEEVSNPKRTGNMF